MTDATRTEPPSALSLHEAPPAAQAVAADDPEEPPSGRSLQAAVRPLPAHLLQSSDVAPFAGPRLTETASDGSLRNARKPAPRLRQTDWTEAGLASAPSHAARTAPSARLPEPRKIADGSSSATVQRLDPAAARRKRSASGTGPLSTRRKTRRLALICNLKPANGTPGGPDDEFEEFDSPATVQALAGLLGAEGYAVTVLEADRSLPRRLVAGNFDLVFNIAEGKGGRCREALVPALCELLGIAYTGSDPLTLAATLDKAVAKRLVSPEVRTPRWRTVRTMADLQDLDLRFPVFAKPNDEGSSKGIRDDSRCEDFAALESLCTRLLDTYGRPVLVEEYVRGAEVTVGVVGNLQPEVVGIMHVVPIQGDAGDFVYSLEVKRDWENRVRYAIPPELPPETCRRIEEAALRAFRLLDCRDVARIDFRVDETGEPCFIEANPLPGLSPTSGDLVLMAKAMGWSWEGLISRIVREAEFRQGVLRPTLVPREGKRKLATVKPIRPLPLLAAAGLEIAESAAPQPRALV